MLTPRSSACAGWRRLSEETEYLKDNKIAKMEEELAELKRKVASSGNKKAELERSARGTFPPVQR